ncbi:MAG: hypothetical protein HDQ88_10990 [Clostridia bacterium]|nr:hypothetical protein [Clostridia bacterium]
MNKYKKIAAIVISTVMAGTMALSLTACGPNDGDDGKKPPHDPVGSGKDLYGIINEDGSINYDAYKRDSEVTLNLSVGYSGPTTGVFSGAGANVTLPDGKTYANGAVKPAWAQMGKDLNISWADYWNGDKTSDNLKNLLSAKLDNGSDKWDSVDLFTTDLSKAVEYEAATEGLILNLGDYLDYMPHFKQFLEQNPVVYLSLLQEGMDTDTGEGKNVLVAPYFDGYNDIERYVLIRQDWSEKLLGDTALTNNGATYASACGVTSVYATAYMGTTGSIEIESANSTGTGTVKIYKNYANVLDQIKKDGTALKAAYEDITGTAYTGDSGNIVDIQNAAINAKSGEVTGKQLVTLLRAYVDACYTTGSEVGSASYYSAENRENLFNGYDACWDVDDLVAMLRCVKTNKDNLSLNANAEIGGIVSRDATISRTPDIERLVGQLYGVRGTHSANEYFYFDKDGNLQDARVNKDFYVAMEAFSKLHKEGLVANYDTSTSYSGYGGLIAAGTTNTEYFMMYDYSQTQTLGGFYVENDDVTPSDSKTVIPCDDYYFGAVVTPVSKWDVNGSGTIENDEIFRFNEGWRTVKTGGLAVNGNLAKEGNEEKLKAALQLVDYLYSEDGQIVSTYGPKADNKTGDNGFWYNEEATEAQINAGEYFSYKGVKYGAPKDQYYKGKVTPLVTENLLQSFKGISTHGWVPVGDVSGAKLNFTNYARMLIGSTLPVGVKDQSFENQLTSVMGSTSAIKVGTVLSLGVIKHLSLDVNGDPWYTCVPTALPVLSVYQTNVINQQEQKDYTYLMGTKKSASNILSLANYIGLKGVTGECNANGVQINYTDLNDLFDATVGTTGKSISTLGNARKAVYQDAWKRAQDYWTYLDANKG